MSAKIATNSINVEKFVLDVCNRPAIWNRNYHCNKSFMEDTWDELSVLHRLPTNVLKAKWKGLRDNFRVEFKRIPRDEVTGILLIRPEDHESKWLHYKSLIFLVDHMRARPAKGNNMDQYYYTDSTEYDTYEEPTIMEPQNSSAINNVIEIPDHHLTPSNTLNIDGVTLNMGTLTAPKLPSVTNGKKRHRECGSDDDVIEIRNNNSTVTNSVQNDDDYHFLMSLHPFMSQIPKSQKLKVRMKIQKLLFKELYKDEDIDDNKFN